MLVSINSVTIPTAGEQDIRIQASNIETMILSDDLFETAEADEVTFIFDKSNVGHRKYLLKILQSNRQTKGKDSLGAMLQALPGSIISLSEAFLER